MGSDSQVDRALAAYQKASPEIRVVILQQAAARVQAQLAVSAAQQQRLAQVAVFLLAAAAVGAQAAVSSQAGIWATRWLIAATSTFGIGSAVSAVGLLSFKIQLPGHRPSWWAGVDLESVDAHTGGAWQAVNSEEVLSSVEAVTKARAKVLLAGIAVGLFGVFCLVLGAISAWP